MPEACLVEIVEVYTLELTTDQVADAVLRAVPDSWPFPPQLRVVSEVVAALDLAESVIPSLAELGRMRLRELGDGLEPAVHRGDGLLLVRLRLAAPLDPRERDEQERPCGKPDHAERARQKCERTSCRGNRRDDLFGDRVRADREGVRRLESVALRRDRDGRAGGGSDSPSESPRSSSSSSSCLCRSGGDCRRCFS